MAETLMTAAEAAAYLRVSAATIRRWVRDGKLKIYPCSFRKNGIIVSKSDLDNRKLVNWDTEPKTTPERVRYLRNRAQLSQFEVSLAIGINPETYRSYERAQNTIKIGTIKRLARLYGVTTDYLLCMDVKEEY